MTKPVTGKRSHKKYKCDTCGNVTLHGTNHWGSFYMTQCRQCGVSTSWTCMEEPPETHGIPEEWKTVRLGDICKIEKV